jgi:stalled ribosome rescue protein Dom34
MLVDGVMEEIEDEGETSYGRADVNKTNRAGVVQLLLIMRSSQEVCDAMRT